MLIHSRRESSFRRFSIKGSTATYRITYNFPVFIISLHYSVLPKKMFWSTTRCCNYCRFLPTSSQLRLCPWTKGEALASAWIHFKNPSVSRSFSYSRVIERLLCCCAISHPQKGFWGFPFYNPHFQDQMGQGQKSKQVTETTSVLSNVFIWVGTDCFIQGTHCWAVNEEKSYSLISASFCWNLDSWGRCLLQTESIWLSGS